MMLRTEYKLAVPGRDDPPVIVSGSDGCVLVSNEGDDFSVIVDCRLIDLLCECLVKARFEVECRQ